MALTLLLKYPSPKSPHGPQTFVDDAIFLRDNPTRETGMKIIEGYSGRAPIINPSHPRPMTPISAKSTTAGQRPPSHKSPLASPARFLQQQGGVEALLQNAAKGVLQRGERLGINQAVRDAVGEVKKNMQNLSTGPSGLSRRSSDIARSSLDEGRDVPSARKALAALEQRNKRLAGLLDDALQDLRKISLSNDDTEEKIETTDLAIGKVQFVQLYLEDSSLPLPSDISPIPSTSKANHDITPSKAPSALVSPVQLPGALQSHRANAVRLTSPSNATNPVTQSNPRSPVVSIRSLQNTIQPITRSQAPIHQPLDITGQNTTISERPSTLIPTRSSLAQSSFAWMLEPDEPSSSLSPAASKRSSPFASSGRKLGTNHNRDKTAFLFGDEREEPDVDSRKSSTQVEAGTEFNLGKIKGKMG
jgi:TBC1 domain family protein 5